MYMKTLDEMFDKEFINPNDAVAPMGSSDVIMLTQASNINVDGNI